MKSLKRYSVWHIAPTQKELLKPLNQVLPNIAPLKSRSNKPLAMNTKELLNIPDILPPSRVLLWYRGVPD
jgi:hypothetical protein